MVLPRSISNVLYVADLDLTEANEDLLFDIFSQIGKVLSVRVCRPDLKLSGDTPRLSYAYVNFNTVEEGMSK